MNELQELRAILQEMIDKAPQQNWIRTRYGDIIDDCQNWDEVVERACVILSKHEGEGQGK